ncbi:hypothetical protein FGF1_28750 [Flavobacteriaceae bacterium GF1]
MRTKHFTGLKGPLLTLFISLGIGTGLFAQNEFITTWETTTANESITIPTTGNGYSYSVDWGDGTTTGGYTGNAEHTYGSIGTYTVKISGNFPRIYFNDTGDKLKLKEINQWGDIAWESMERAFWGCSNMEVKASDAPDLSSVESISIMFFDCTSLTGDASFSNWNWDTSNVIHMVSTFRNATAFNGDVSSWNTSNVVNMVGTFWGASTFNQNIGSWDTSKADNMISVLRDASSFDQNLGAWNLGNLNTGTSMLDGTALSIENWDKTLIGWRNNTVFTKTPTNIGASGLKYCEEGTARTALIVNGVNITGDGLSDTPLVAECQSTVTLQLDTNGTATLTPNLVDNGSDACGMSLSLSENSFTAVGTPTVTLTVSNGNSNTATCTTTVNVVDDTPPIITLEGDNPLILELGETYVDPGVKATDNVDGDISNSVFVDSSSVDTSTVTVGDGYTVTYTVSDAQGNGPTAVTRRVQVIDPPVEITAFNFSEQLGETTIDPDNHTVTLEVVNGTDLTNLVATFTVSDGTSVEVNDVDQESEVTPNDFTNPVSYKVISPRGQVEKLWTVTVMESQRPFVHITPGTVGEPFEFVGGNVQGAFPITITFSTKVTGFEESDVQVTNGELREFELEDPNTSTYTTWVRPTGGGDITITVPENVAMDEAGINQNLAKSIFVGYNTSLSVTITGVSYTNSQNEITLTIRFATDITGFDESDIIYSDNTSLNNFIKISNNEYTVDMEPPTVDGAVAEVLIPPHVATATDQSKRNMPTTFTVTYDTTPPEVTLVFPDTSEYPWVVPGRMTNDSGAYLLVTANEELSNLNSSLDESFVSVENCAYDDGYFEGELYLDGLPGPINGDIARVQLLAGAFTDLAGNVSQASNTVEFVYDYAVDEPNFFPEDNGTDIDPFENLTLTFNEDVFAGRGDIDIYRASDNFLVSRIDVEVDEQRVSFNGTTVTIDPANPLDYDTDYYLNIGPEVFQDIFGNEYDGIADNASWNFRTKIEPDNKAPLITLLGDNPMYVAVGNTYVEPGATAEDDRDGVIGSDEITIGGDDVNTSVENTYEVTYNVKDAVGNAAPQVVREVIVDATSPEITLLGDNPMYLSVGETYGEPGATATDDKEGTITVRIAIGGDEVKTNVEGIYKVTYDVKDAAGNAATQKVRQVIVDATPPVITLLGNNPIYLNVGDTYVEPGATAKDDRDGDIVSEGITVGGDAVDTSVEAAYEVTYDVKDAAGNAATQVVRQVIVDSTPPIITLLGDNPMYVALGDIYVEPGATAKDDRDGDIEGDDITIGGDIVNTALLGTYEVTYNVRDKAGNAADQRTRVVLVETDCTLLELTANNFQILVSDETCSGKENGSIHIQATTALDYTVSIADTDDSFRSELLVDGLAPGAYTLCIGLEGVADCEQCFEATIMPGMVLEGTSAVVRNSIARAQVSVSMISGTAPYKVFVNGHYQATYGTPDFMVDAVDGDQVKVTSSLPCEGTFSVPVELQGQVSAFPNPVTSELTVTLPSGMDHCALSVHQMNGALVFQEVYDTTSGYVQISMEGLPSGMYLLKVQDKKNPITFKIVKK